MNFFEQFTTEHLKEGTNISLTISIKEGILSVLYCPNTETKKTIVMSGSADEMDGNFFSEITKLKNAPVKKEFAASVIEDEDEEKETKKSSSKIHKDPPKESAADKKARIAKENYDKAMKSGNESVDKRQWARATMYFKKALGFIKSDATAKQRIQDVIDLKKNGGKPIAPVVQTEIPLTENSEKENPKKIEQTIPAVNEEIKQPLSGIAHNDQKTEQESSVKKEEKIIPVTETKKEETQNPGADSNQEDEAMKKEMITVLLKDAEENFTAKKFDAAMDLFNQAMILDPTNGKIAERFKQSKLWHAAMQRVNSQNA